MKNRKYVNVNICPMKIYGSSTGHPPIQVKINHEDVKDQNRIWFTG
jgi:hypothetical protein